jgi:hypothetical protein
MSGIHTFAVRRKGTKRSESWYLAPPPPSPQAEDIPARKKPRREEPLPTTTVDEAARKTAAPDVSVGLAPPATPPSTTLRRSRRQTQLPARKKPRLGKPLTRTTAKAARKTASPDVSVGLPPPAADNSDANANPVTDTHSNAEATRATILWTPEEDAELTDEDWAAITALVPGQTRKQCSKRWDLHYALKPNIAGTAERTGTWGEDEDLKLKDAVKTHGGQDWASIAALVPGRTKNQCNQRWCYVLDPITALTAGQKGKWTEDEDLKLKGAVQMYGGKNWAAITVLVPGRTKSQCYQRWRDVLKPCIHGAKGRNVSWTAAEDSKLKESVQMYGSKNWVAVAALVPSRMKSQCRHRWRNALNPSIDRSNVRSGKWTEDEDLKLMNAVQTHGGQDWAAIAALVPGRTKNQCHVRWHNALDPSIDRKIERKGSWTADEDFRLKDAVQTHGGKNWDKIAALVPGRTKSQCHSRWRNALDPSIDRTAGRTGKWTEDEDNKLKKAVQLHGGKKWAAIALLVPGRTKYQCTTRWHDALNPSIALTAGRKGKWTEDEDIKLSHAVQTHGGKNWNSIAAMVPGRAQKQCSSRWHEVLNPSIALTAGRKGKWTEDEDLKLKDAVQLYSGKDWAAITALVPGRTKCQCASRWHNALNHVSARVDGIMP